MSNSTFLKMAGHIGHCSTFAGILFGFDGGGFGLGLGYSYFLGPLLKKPGCSNLLNLVAVLVTSTLEAEQL
jgi:hypothetical protein